VSSVRVAGEPMAQELSFDLDDEPRAEGEAFCVDVDGFEGPLDLLLELARRQKARSCARDLNTRAGRTISSFH